MFRRSCCFAAWCEWLLCRCLRNCRLWREVLASEANNQKGGVRTSGLRLYYTYSLEMRPTVRVHVERYRPSVCQPQSLRRAVSYIILHWPKCVSLSLSLYIYIYIYVYIYIHIHTYTHFDRRANFIDNGVHAKTACNSPCGIISGCLREPKRFSRFIIGSFSES